MPTAQEVPIDPGVDKTEQLWKAYPDTFAQRASNGKWVAYPWLQALSTLITPLIVKGGARILLSAPPQHGKSEFLSNWLPTWFLHNNPTKKVILGTYSQDYANSWGTKVRDNLLFNPEAAIPMRRDTQSKKKFMTAQGGQMMVAGVDGPATGMGADLVVVDDPYKGPQEAMSEVIRAKVMDWFRAVATTRLQSGGSVVVMHTRWMDDDLIGTLAKEEGWTYINLKAIWEAGDPKNPDVDLLGRAEGEPLCPERFTVEDLKRIRREVTDLFWFPMYQGSAVDVKGAIIAAVDIQYYDDDPAELAKRMDQIAIFADLTYSKDEENDYAVFEAWGQKGANIYLIGQIRDQMGIHDQLLSFATIIERYPDAFHKQIEKKANGAAVIELCEDKIPGIVADNPQTSKGARLAVVSPLYKSHNVFYPNPALPGREWVKVNVYEVTRMTLSGPKSKNDDTVDTGSMAVKYFGNMAGAISRLEALARR